MDIAPVKGTLLERLPPAERDHLLAVGDRRRFGSGEVLLRQGDPSDHVLVLLSGWVRVYSTNREGQEVVLAVRGPGDVIGELAALHGWERTASVQALGPVEVHQIRREPFLECLSARPAITIMVTRQVAVRMREAENALLEFATQDVTRRVASYLLRIARQLGVAGSDGIELTQQEIANRVGASPRAVARAMAVLRERGIVVTNRRRIMVVRPDVLRSLSGQ